MIGSMTAVVSSAGYPELVGWSAQPDGAQNIAPMAPVSIARPLIMVPSITPTLASPVGFASPARARFAVWESPNRRGPFDENDGRAESLRGAPPAHCKSCGAAS